MKEMNKLVLVVTTWRNRVLQYVLCISIRDKGINMKETDINEMT